MYEHAWGSSQMTKVTLVQSNSKDTPRWQRQRYGPQLQKSDRGKRGLADLAGRRPINIGNGQKYFPISDILVTVIYGGPFAIIGSMVSEFRGEPLALRTRS